MQIYGFPYYWEGHLQNVVDTDRYTQLLLILLCLSEAHFSEKISRSLIQKYLAGLIERSPPRYLNVLILIITTDEYKNQLFPMHEMKITKATERYGCDVSI